MAEQRRVYRFACGFLRCALPLVPSHLRDDWEAEWQGETWTYLDTPAATFGGLAWRLTGVIPHALWLRRNEWRLDTMLHDLKFAWRSTCKRPGFSLFIVALLAIGIGASSAMFTVVNSVLIQPLPYPQADQLVYLNGSFDKSDNAAISPPDFLDYRAANTVFTSLAAERGGNNAVLSGNGDPERVSASGVTANYFATLGINPILGRAFRPEEEDAGQAEVAVLSYGLWQRRYGGDPHVVGTSVLIDGKQTAIVGVMPEVLDRTLATALWRPIGFHGQYTSVRRFHMLRAVGRLKPGVSIGQATATMDVIAKQLATTYPENETWHLRLRPYRDVIVGDAGSTLVILLGAVGMLLLIACGNVASLLLARATSRQGEIAIRTSLGASRTRLVRQLLTESLVYAVAGGAAGLALAVLMLRGIRVAAADALPRMGEVGINGQVLIFTVLLALLTALVFGLAPALHAIRSNLSGAFAGTTRGGSASRRSVRLRDALVAAQVALSLVLLIGSGLLIRSLWRLQHVDTGFVSERVLTAEVRLSKAEYNDSLTLLRFWRELTTKLHAMPGVISSSAANTIPLTGGSDTYFWIEGHAPTNEADRRNAMINSVDGQYFATMQIPLLEGRSFNATEENGGPNGVVINQTLAKRLFPNESAVGKQLVLDFGTPFHATIIGVTGDVLAFGLNSQAPGTIYYSPYQSILGAGRINVVLRAKGDPISLARGVREAVASLDRDIPVANVQAMHDLIGNTVSSERLSSHLLLGFAGVALLLAVVGLYGVLGYVVSQRTREMGIRLALGAPRRDIFGMVVRRGMLIVAAGIALGVAVSLVATQLLASMLFQVGRADPVVFALTAATLAIAGLVASALPARRAMTVDPQVALRAE